MLKFWVILSIHVVLVFQSSCTNGSNVLCLFTTRSPSHLIISLSAVDGIIDNGHNVTVVTILPVVTESTKYRHIRLDMTNETRNAVKDVIANGNKELANILTMYNYVNLMFKQSEDSLNDNQMKSLMNESFDLVIIGYFFNEFYLGLAAHFHCPVVIIWQVQPIQIAHDFVGNPTEIAYVPHAWSSFTQPMSFGERVINYVESIIDCALKWIIYYANMHYYKKNFPVPQYPKYSDMLMNISLVLVNHHFSQTPVRALVPGMVEIGGIQIKEKLDQPPDNLQRFLNESSKSGCIYFSLGTNVKMAELDPKLISVFYNVLSTLNQNILLKWEGDKLPGNASNIMFHKWFPQNEILADSNTKLFITHGGFGSITEALHYGVPLLVIPFFNDQYANAKYVTKSKWGLTLSHASLSEKEFRDSINEILYNNDYRSQIQKLSKIYRDRLVSPRKTATFWLEYILRHHGAPHIQSPAVHMNFIQYYSIDVIVFIILSTFILFKIFTYTLKLILYSYRYIFRTISLQNKLKQS